MTSNSPSPASHVDIPTTDSTPVAYIGGLYESHSEVVQGLLREFVNGLIDVHPLPNDPGTLRLEFSDVACAQRAIAVLNRHPALQGEGPYYCSPEPAEHPRPDVPFTARILRAQRCIVPSSDRHRPRWMDDREDAMCNPAPWPDDFPTPEDVYDACIALGPIFSVEIWPFKSVNGSPWSARVQFYTPEDAAALETQLRGSLLCGWEVRCNVLWEDAHRNWIQSTLAALKAKRATTEMPERMWMTPEKRRESLHSTSQAPAP